MPFAAHAGPCVSAVSGAPASSSAWRRRLISTLRCTSSNGQRSKRSGMRERPLDEARRCSASAPHRSRSRRKRRCGTSWRWRCRHADLAEQEAGRRAVRPRDSRARSECPSRASSRSAAWSPGSPQTSGWTIFWIEQAPDEDVAEPRVGELLEPAGAGAVLGIGWEAAGGPDRLRRDRRRSPRNR